MKRSELSKKLHDKSCDGWGTKLFDIHRTGYLTEILRYLTRKYCTAIPILLVEIRLQLTGGAQ